MDSRTQPSAFAERLACAIDEGLADAGLSVEGLARQVGLSRRQLHRRAVEEFGEHPRDLILGRRLETARLLIESRAVERVQSLADRVGLSPRYLARAYRARYGTPPSEALRAARRRVHTPRPFPPLRVDLETS